MHKWIQTLTWQLSGIRWQGFQEEAQNKKAVRIVSTGRQGRNPLWVSVEDEKSKSTDSGTAANSNLVYGLIWNVSA